MHAGATACLPKPYLPSALIALISTAMNQVCERQWEAFPALPAAALKSSVTMFNTVADMLATGQPIQYPDINAGCQPLLEAVNADGVVHLLQGVRQHDDYTYAHSLRVAVFLSVFARSLGLSWAEQAVLTAGGLLHDIGKTAIPTLLLNKAGRLTDSEFGIMKGHVAASISLLEKSPSLPDGVLVIAGQHHEKLDGSGYPHGLPGAKLNELARMAAIVDIFSALTDRRVYKATMTPDHAFALMAEEMSAQLDMPLLRCFPPDPVRFPYRAAAAGGLSPVSLFPVACNATDFVDIATSQKSGNRPWQSNPGTPKPSRLHAGWRADESHRRRRGADLPNHLLPVQKPRTRGEFVRAEGIREYLHPHHEPDQRRARRAAGGDRRRGGRFKRSAPARRLPLIPSRTWPAPATTSSPRPICTAAPGTCSPTR